MSSWSAFSFSLTKETVQKIKNLSKEKLITLNQNSRRQHINLSCRVLQNEKILDIIKGVNGGKWYIIDFSRHGEVEAIVTSVYSKTWDFKKGDTLSKNKYSVRPDKNDFSGAVKLIRYGANSKCQLIYDLFMYSGYILSLSK